MGGLAGNSSFDLDAELGFGGGGADLAVAVPLANKPDDDVPWPVGVTPEPRDIDLPLARIEARAGYGPRPKSILGAPVYALRASVALRELERALVAAEKELARVEGLRDERLAELGNLLRPELSMKDRFVALYADATRFDELVEERMRALTVANAGGASELSEIEARIQAAREERSRREAKVSAHREVVLESERVLARSEAQRKRAEIEKRNIERLALERVGEGALMPEDLAVRYLSIETEVSQAKRAVAESAAQKRDLAAFLKALENELREAAAFEQRLLGEKEGFLIAHEGDVGTHVGMLDEAKLGRIRELARAARACLDLRGEVPVDKEIRRDLNSLDAAVRVAFAEVELLQRSIAHVDRSALNQGRTIGIAFAAAAFLGLFGAMIF